ncbi:MAG: 3'-5' exonuclease [Bacteroidales bacterium]
MKDFAAIDLETANHHRTSICSVGVVIVRGGKVVNEFYRLIKPYPNYYSGWATECHGLSVQDTAESPLFPEVWTEIAPQIEGLPLVAHNKGFDEPHLIKCHEYYNMQYPDYTFACTLSASRRNFPELSNHQLHTVSAHVGFDLDNHHHALADAEACAMIAIEIL